jgi:putative tryptophan/tyrosine transport system substrate-binding protein
VKRREFMTLLGGAAAAWPLAARAQQAKMPTVGILALGNPPVEPFVKGLQDGLQAVGYSEDRNIRLEIRSAGGDAGRLPELAAELVRLKVDAIVAYQTPSATAAKQATSDIPIVMAGVGDPVGTGLVASLARPGGNVTGTTAGAVEVAGKLVELMREVLRPRRFAVLANETDPFTNPYLAETDRVARSIGLEMEPVMVRPASPLDAAFESMTTKRAEAVFIQGSLVRKDAVDLALRHRLPSLSTSNTLPRLGGLTSYSAGAGFREIAAYIDKLLKGAKPADLPVSFPTKFELTVNLKTAKALGITIPPTLLTRADEVIE